ncbi:hypothetical protein AMK16_01380 [Streptomyces sp. CB00455]|uniref:PepSY domain-containing protein n=1 Tax=Streptomyces sp. CB00455 TaxID=1703927 RepID=UPI00093F182E|nr:PepSY domain-containing protein [Streptomyces sp. CB00455]OKK21928.1 hypothetical protein AMK16_01380 [Streptomyces sp. CB00455]
MNTLTRLRGLAVGLAVSSTLLAGACGGGGHDPVTAAPAAPSSSPAGPSGGRSAPSEDQRERMAVVPAAKVRWDQAAQTAVSGVPQGRLVEIELTASRSAGTGTASSSANPASPSPAAAAPVWDVTVATDDGTAHDVQVDAVTGKVTRSRVEPGQDADDKRKLAKQLKAATTTVQHAVRTGTGRKQGTVTAVELDHDVWSVDIVTPDWNKTTYDIDAAKGTVVREHVDRD